MISSGLTRVDALLDDPVFFAPFAAVEFERHAVTPEQITLWDLPTRPTKGTDTRARGFVGESVEVDAIPPSRLRALVRDAIT